MRHITRRQIQRRVSTHSRPKAAASGRRGAVLHRTGFNSQPPEGGCVLRTAIPQRVVWFQLTAARRRLRPGLLDAISVASFNSQPPEGGCSR